MKKTLLLLILLLSAAMAGAAPRPINEAEEAAVRFVAAHLRTGPHVLWDALSASSPLRKLGAAEARKEIELRAGPSAGSEWELATTGPKSPNTAAFHVTFASGVDDTIVLDMTREGTVWKIADIRSMSDPGTAYVPPVKTAEERPAFALATVLPISLGVVGVVALVLLFVFRSSRALRLGFAGAAVLALAGFAATFYMAKRGDGALAVNAASAAGTVSPDKARQTLVELRRRAASGDGIDEAVLRGLDEASRDRARLWSAQLDLQRNDFAAAERQLAQHRQRYDTPLAQILTGRMAFLKNKDVDAVIAYERAMDRGPERDDLLYETASVLVTVGFRDRAERYFRRLDEIGTREADAYYSLAVLESLKRERGEESAEKFMLAGFKLRPEMRAELVKIGALYAVLQREQVRQLFAMWRSDEPLITPARLSQRPLEIPPGSSARVVGEHLEVDLIGSKLQVPGGSFMAPGGTPVLDAGTWGRSEAAEALNDAPKLAKVAGQASTYAQPALSRRIVETANALAEHHRWERVAELTSGVMASFDLVPADLFLLKAEAQKRTGRSDNARALVKELAARPSLLRRMDGYQLLEAGELAASLDEYDLAIKLMERAGSVKAMPHLDDRIRQLYLDQRLATFAAHETPHFIIRYSTEETGKAGAEIMGTIAEAELKRLQKWIRLPEPAPVTINVLSWDTFRGTYTGSDHILGFYDGQITIPFANVSSWPPEIVAILSHELAHALIAQRTRDQAPRWFHEGLAQRVESIQFKRNPFNMYEPEKLMAFGLVDDVVTYSPDPSMIGQGYLVAHALVRYIEHRYGAAGLGRMLDAFDAGATTDEAIETLSGGRLADFEAAFSEWGRDQVFENTDLVSYEGATAPPIRRRVSRTTEY